MMLILHPKVFDDERFHLTGGNVLKAANVNT